uniref:Putative secreted protein n=1 Tax=Amblyomma triste TaxID=251400 RepID=A0A023G215_AMBTT
MVHTHTHHSPHYCLPLFPLSLLAAVAPSCPFLFTLFSSLFPAVLSMWTEVYGFTYVPSGEQSTGTSDACSRFQLRGSLLLFHPSQWQHSRGCIVLARTVISQPAMMSWGAVTGS